MVPGEGDNVIAHAQLVYGNGMIMLGSAGSGSFDELQKPVGDVADGSVVTQSAYIVVPNVDAHHRVAVAAGAKVVIPPEDHDSGGRMYSCKDPEGHLWNFGTYDPYAEEQSS